MRIKVDKKYWGCYLSLLLAFANDSFRFTDSGLTSFYRLFSPILIFYLLRKRMGIYLNAFKVFGIFVVYSLIVSLLYYHRIQYSYYLFAGYLLVEYMVIYYLKKEKGSGFDADFFTFLDRVGVVLIIAGFFQMVYRFRFPFVILPAERGVNLCFSNENELAAPLSALGIIYMFTFYFMKRKWDGIKFLCIAMILFVNDAKLCIIGVSIALMILFVELLFSKICSGRQLSGMTKVCMISAILVAVIYSLVLLDVEFRFRDYRINLEELILDSWKAIVQGRAFSAGGSIADRTDAIIYGLLELKNSCFLGIGLANSTYMLTLPQYKLMTAESMHNILAQFLCEFGGLAILVYAYVVKRLYYRVRSVNKNWKSRLKVVYAIAFIFISSQSSIGILSNYMLWAITIYIVLMDNNSDRRIHYPYCQGGVAEHVPKRK